MGPLIFFAILAFIVFIAIIKTAVIVPQKTAYIVERHGKYRCTLDAGFHILVPFFDRVAYRHTLKEQAIDVPPQECITKDNIAVSVDGILYMQVMDPAKASYGIGNYLFATTQLAQTTMRSEMGKLDLDRSFEERYCNPMNYPQWFLEDQHHQSITIAWKVLGTPDVMRDLEALMLEAERLADTPKSKARVANWRAGVFEYMRAGEIEGQRRLRLGK